MNAHQWIEANKSQLIHISKTIWAYAEPALAEAKSAALIAETLKNAGFRIETNVAEMPTAFVAVWGSGEPRIGFLGEYDALKNMSQQAVPYQAPDVGLYGHGCGHNLLGVGSLGAALALRYEMEAKHLLGTVVYFGCPAEETMTGKVLMANSGAFDELDVALSWHPASVNGVINQDFLAMQTLQYTFSGIASHAAASPEKGRSALDAVELMNVGVNYLREHVPDDVRIHYSITDGGGEPNLVHTHAQSWYFVRAARRDTVDSVLERIEKVAQGAAMMTETEVVTSFISGCKHLLHNKALDALLFDCLHSTKRPVWAENELDFAHRICASLTAQERRSTLALFDNHLNLQDMTADTIMELTGVHTKFFASTDVSEVSWKTPTGQIWACCAPPGIMTHTWQFSACSGSKIGQLGMLYASEVLANAGYRLIKDSQLLAAVRRDFKEELKREARLAKD